MELAANFLLPRKLPCHAEAEKVKKMRNQRWWSRKLESRQAEAEEGTEGETHPT
jgi:ribosomal protein L9